MKNKQVIKSKELEMCTINKKYPSQINMYTDEVKNLVAKRLEYLNKLNINKKSITNLKSYLQKLSGMLSEIVNNASKNKLISDNVINSFEDEMKKFHDELACDEEEILENICKDNNTNQNENNILESLENNENLQKLTKIPKTIDKNKLLIEYKKGNRRSDQISNNIIKKENLLPNIFTTGINTITNNNLQNLHRDHKQDSHSPINNNLPINFYKNNKYSRTFKNSQKYQTSHSTQSPHHEYKGIFTKYEYLNSKNSSKNLNNHKFISNNIHNNQSPEKKNHSNNSIEEINNENSIEKENSDIFTTDFENTKNNEFARLIKKRSQLEKINIKLEKNFKEVEKLFEKKLKDLNTTTENNQKKLNLIQKQNDLLAIEIEELNKIVSLSLEEKKIKREIRESHTKLMKNIAQPTGNPAENNTDISETRNEILQELNNILTAEGEKTDKLNKNNNIDAMVIEEERQENNQINSLMNENDNENEEIIIENKNLKCNINIKFDFFHKIVPDISNVEHIDEIESTLHKRDKTNNIQVNYIQIGMQGN